MEHERAETCQRREGSPVAESSAASDDPVVTLNVGGTVLQTRRSTLTWSSRYFENIFAGPFKHEHGQLFLDCEPEIFAHVLYFFRHRKLRPRVPLVEMEDLANLYSIDILLEEIARRRQVGRLVGTWFFQTLLFSLTSLEELEYTIYEHNGKLWFYEAAIMDGEVTRHIGQMHREEDCFIVTEEWGEVQLAIKGDVLMTSWRYTEMEHWDHHVLAKRKC